MSKPSKSERLAVNHPIYCWLLIVFAPVLFACARPDTRVDLEKLSGVDTILVLPFQHIDTVEIEPVIIDCKLCRQRHVFEAVATDDAVFMSTRLMDLLHNVETFQYIFHDQAQRTSPDLNVDRLVRKDTVDILPSDAIATGVDAVLMGYIFRFRERVGTSYGIESPASVAFSLILTSLEDSQVVWHSHYEETQDALFNNLLTLGKFIRRKARWVTARELANEALEDMLSTLEKP